MKNDAVTSNPFSTRYVKPGAIPWFEENATSLDEFAEDVLARRGVFQILGPHGSGKSTFVHALVETLLRKVQRPDAVTKHEVNAEWFAIHRNEDRSRLSDVLRSVDSPDANKSMMVFAVDGLELLSFWERWYWLRRFRRCREVVLLTTHRPLRGVNVLKIIQPSRDVLKQVVAYLLREYERAEDLGVAGSFSSSRLDEVFAMHRGDLRECLMTLYDDWELLDAKV